MSLYVLRCRSTIKSFIFLILGLTQSFFNKSQLKSPAMIISLFSSSIFGRNSSKHCRNTIFESGGRYQVETKIGLLFGFLISRHNASTCLEIRSLRSTYEILLRKYIATHPPFRFRSCLIIS